jgi:hypothetical protein
LKKTNASNWTHIAALNLIADHAAGIEVDPLKLEAARNIVARAHSPRAAA